jgi:ribosomal protein S21
MAANVSVTKFEGEPVEQLIKRFMRAVMQSGIMKEIHSRSHAKSRSQARREKDLKARHRVEKQKRKAQRERDHKTMTVGRRPMHTTKFPPSNTVTVEKKKEFEYRQ